MVRVYALALASRGSQLSPARTVILLVRASCAPPACIGLLRTLGSYQVASLLGALDRGPRARQRLAGDFGNEQQGDGSIATNITPIVNTASTTKTITKAGLSGKPTVFLRYVGTYPLSM
jgi:hypothetical protein